MVLTDVELDHRLVSSALVTAPGFGCTSGSRFQYNGCILQKKGLKTIQPFTALFVDFIIVQVKCPWCKAAISSPEGADVMWYVSTSIY